MLKKDKLFQLIQSLSSEEKAYFKKYAQMNTQSKKPDYVHLFEALDKLKVYEEDVFLKKYEKAIFVKYFSAKKRHLNDKIQESLIVLYGRDGLQNELQQYLILFNILDKKRLYDELQMKIRNAKKKAITIGEYGFLGLLVNWEKKILFKSNDKKAYQLLKKLVVEQNQYTEIAESERKYENIYQQLNLLIKNDLHLKKAETRLQFTQLVESTLLVDDLLLPSYKAQVYYHRIRTLKFKYNNEQERAYQESKQFISVFEKKKEKQLYEYEYYYMTLCSHARICHTHQKFEELGEILAKMETILPKLRMNESSTEAFDTACHIGIGYYLNTQQFDKAIHLAKEIDQKWTDLIQVIEEGKQLFYCYNIMLAYWIVNDLRTAMIWLSRIVNFGVPAQGKDFVYAARFFQLIIYYDLKDEDLDKKIATTWRTLKKHEQLTDFAKLVMQHLKKLTEAIDRYDKNAILISLKNELILLQNRLKTAQKRPPLALDETILWCEKLLLQTPLIELLKRID